MTSEAQIVNTEFFKSIICSKVMVFQIMGGAFNIFFTFVYIYLSCSSNQNVNALHKVYKQKNQLVGHFIM